MSGARIYVFAFAVLLLPAAASAQSQVIVSGYGSRPIQSGEVVGVDLATGETRWSVGPSSGGQVITTADGRFALWLSSNQLVARDLVTGAVITVPLPSNPVGLIAHPRRTIVFVMLGSGRVLILEPSGTREIVVCDSAAHASITTDGGSLFVACGSRVVVMNTSSHALREIPIIGTAQRIQVNSDGSRFATFHHAQTNTDVAVALYDAATGVRLATAPPEPLFGTAATRTGGINGTDPARTRLFVSFRFTSQLGESGVTHVLNFETLDRIGVFPRPFSQIAFIPESLHAIATQSTDFLCYVHVIHTGSFAIEQTFQVGSSCAPGVALTVAPRAPIRVTSTVSNRRVTVNWELPFDSAAATRFVLEASLTPGGPPIVTMALSADQTFAVDNVPSGTYYVRISASNFVGASAFSPEARITVP